MGRQDEHKQQQEAGTVPAGADPPTLALRELWRALPARSWRRDPAVERRCAAHCGAKQTPLASGATPAAGPRRRAEQRIHNVATDDRRHEGAGMRRVRSREAGFANGSGVFGGGFL